MFKTPGRYIEIDNTAATADLLSDLLPPYAALFNPTVDQVNAINAAAPELFIFIFVTKPIFNDNWDFLTKSDYICMPMSLENIDQNSRWNAANAVIKRVFLQKAIDTRSGTTLKPV